MRWSWTYLYSESPTSAIDYCSECLEKIRMSPFIKLVYQCDDMKAQMREHTIRYITLKDGKLINNLNSVWFVNPTSNCWSRNPDRHTHTCSLYTYNIAQNYIPDRWGCHVNLMLEHKIIYMCKSAYWSLITKSYSYRMRSNTHFSPGQ